MNRIRFVVTKGFKLLMWCAIVSLVWIVLSCEEFCEEQTRAAIVVNFYSSKSDKEASAGVQIKGIENDSILYAMATYSQVLLPINPTAEEMTFSITYGAFPADTLIFIYTLHPGFISYECGCASFAELHEIVLKETDTLTEEEDEEEQGVPEEPEEQVNSNIIWKITRPVIKPVSYRPGVINAENIRIYY